MKKLVRGGIYCSGMLILALGITLTTKAGLGVSPVVSLGYSVSEIWRLNFGNTVLGMYTLFVIGQFALRGRRSHWWDLLQLPLSLVFSRALNLCSALIPYDSAAHGFWANFALLLLAVTLTGLGVAMTIDMCLVPNPGDGIVQAVAERMGRDQGFAKNVFDVGCVCVTCALGLLFAGEVVGIGVGTLAAMIGVGRIIALVNHFFKEKMCLAAGVTPPAT